jgi:WD repeat-containing protein 45
MSGQVVIWDDAKQKAVITLEFRTQVYRVRLSRSRIVVALQNSIHIYAFSSPPQKLSVYETTNNFLGLCCLGDKLIAFPGPRPGQVQMVEIDTGNISIIPAHSTALRAMEISPDGEVLATASETVRERASVRIPTESPPA